MECNHETLLDTLGVTSNPWDHLDDESAAIKAENSEQLMELYQNQLKQFNDELEAINSASQLPIPSTFHKTQLEIELKDIQCRLYERRTEMSVIDEAIFLSQAVVVRCNTNPNQYLDSNLYDEYREAPAEELADKIEQCQQEMQQMKVNNIEHVSTEQYGHLIESIKKVTEYTVSPVSSLRRCKVARRAYPVINKLLAKMLKDTIYAYRLTFNVVMGDFIRHASLYFYTRRLLDPVKFDDFSWNCFDMGRLKAIDFVVDWSDNRSNVIGVTSLRKVKGLLLILHIINYLSVFKFIIIDEEMFKVSENVA